MSMTPKVSESRGNAAFSRPTSAYVHDDVSATPTRASFHMGAAEDEDEDDDADEHGDEVEDDEEFESHYSRQESPVSSGVSEDESASTGPGLNSWSHDEGARELVSVQRVNSMPSTTPVHPHSVYGRMHGSQSTTALARAPPLPPPLYPPFYNKPPTPLPPSPSFTSLLRPPSLLNRSTASTRPTTPDSSDVDTPNDTEAAVAHSARRANPLPPTAPQVPTYEYYGFVLYLASSLAFLIYILWSYLPSPFLHALGITYYPNRWWSLAIPAWIVMMLVYIYVALACYNTEHLTLRLDHIETMVDETSNIAILDDNGQVRRGGSKRWVREMEERKRYEAHQHHKDKKRKSGGHGQSHGKREKKKERKPTEQRYGYNGPATTMGRAGGLSWTQIWSTGTDAVMDVPLGGVCEVLYGSE